MQQSQKNPFDLLQVPLYFDIWASPTNKQNSPHWTVEWCSQKAQSDNVII